MSLGDFFPKDFKDIYLNGKIKPGTALLLKVESFKINHPKYIILTALSSDKKQICSVVINTEINKNVYKSEKIRKLHIKIRVEEHDFLKYDSYINCTQLLEYSVKEIEKFIKEKPERVLGTVSEEILKKIHNTLTFAETIDNKTKKKYGFALK